MVSASIAPCSATRAAPPTCTGGDRSPVPDGSTGPVTGLHPEQRQNRGAHCTTRCVGAHISAARADFFRVGHRILRGDTRRSTRHTRQGIQKARQPAGSLPRHSGLLRRAMHTALRENTTVSKLNLQESFLQGQGVKKRLYRQRGSPTHQRATTLTNARPQYPDWSKAAAHA